MHSRGHTHTHSKSSERTNGSEKNSCELTVNLSLNVVNRIPKSSSIEKNLILCREKERGKREREGEREREIGADGGRQREGEREKERERGRERVTDKEYITSESQC